VIDVGMGENDRVDRFGIHRKMAILGVSFGPSSLKHAAVEKDALAGGFDKVHRAGNGPGGAVESDFHLGMRATF
jgi:hypothetical protein